MIAIVLGVVQWHESQRVMACMREALLRPMCVSTPRVPVVDLPTGVCSGRENQGE